MSDDALRKELEAVWSGMLRCFAEYRLDDVRKYADVPEGMPRPSRAECEEFARMMPNPSKGRFLKLVRDGDRVGYYAETSDRDRSEVTVFRFVRGDSGWRIVPGPHSCSSYSTERTDAATMVKWIETEPTLAVRPEGGDVPPPPAAKPPSGGIEFEEDARPDAEIAKALEHLWARLRDAMSRGALDEVERLSVSEGPERPTGDDLKRWVKEVPDLSKCEFLTLRRSARKPHLIGYYASRPSATKGRATIVLIVFGRAGNEWKFLLHPSSIEEVEVEAASREELLRQVDGHPSLRVD